MFKPILAKQVGSENLKVMTLGGKGAAAPLNVYSASPKKWPLAGTGVGLLTVGKLYGGILIYENWRSTKFGHLEELRQQVSPVRQTPPELNGVQVSVTTNDVFLTWLNNEKSL